MHQGHQRKRDQIWSLGVENLAKARKCKFNSGISELEKKIHFSFRADGRGNNPSCSFQERGMMPCTSWVKESHVLIKQGRDVTKVNTSIYKFKEESNNHFLPFRKNQLTI